MGVSKLIGKVVTAALSDVGLPAPADIIQTVLLKDHRFVGYRYRYDGGYAIVQAGGNVIEFFSEDGKSLTSTAIETEKEAAA